MLLFPALLLSPLQELHIQYHYLLDLVVLRNLLPRILLQYLHIHPQIQRHRHILKMKINYCNFCGSVFGSGNNIENLQIIMAFLSFDYLIGYYQEDCQG